MKRRSYGRDAGLSFRMLFTGALLGVLYVAFAVVLFQVLNVGLIPMLLIVIGLAVFQYFTSDKLALAASGAKVVSEQEAPELHTMIERLARWPICPNPRWPSSTRRPERVRDGPQPQARGCRGDHRASGAVSSRTRSRACSPTSSLISRTVTSSS